MNSKQKTSNDELLPFLVQLNMRPVFTSIHHADAAAAATAAVAATGIRYCWW